MPERLQEIAEALVQRVHRVKQGEIDKCIRRQQQNNISNATNTAHTIIDPQTRALVDALNPFTVEYLMQSIHVYRIYDYVEQLSCMASLPAFLDQHPRVKVVILDSVSLTTLRTCILVFVCPSIYLSISICLSSCISTCLSMCLESHGRTSKSWSSCC